MGESAASRRRIPVPVLHPFLVGMLPAVHFYETNFRVVPGGDLVRPIVLAWALAGLVLGLCRLGSRSWARAGLVATPLLAVVFKGADLGPALSVACLVVAGVAGGLLRRFPGAAWPDRLTLPLDAVLAVLVVLPLLAVARAERGAEPPRPTAFFETRVPLDAGPDAVRPDIYYLLVDGLGQPAYVEEHFPLDAAEYNAPLSGRGFTVLRHATSNYPQTALSAAATLNMAYLPELLDIPDPHSRDRRPLYTLAGRSRVARSLAAAGYRIVDFPSGYPATRQALADRRSAPFLAPGFLEFYLIEDGVVPLALKLLGRGPADLSFALRRARLDHILDGLPAARRGLAPDEPAFVFAHILAPHPPFVFGRQGQALRSRAAFAYVDGDHWLNLHGREDHSYRQRYADQAAWIMHRLGEAVDGILAASDRPLVIIVQGDHGPGSGLVWDRPRLTDHDERFGIFDAWYTRGTGPLDVREGQTAVDTFPVLFNGLFGTRIEPLRPAHWYARMREPYVFFPVGR